MYNVKLILILAERIENNVMIDQNIEGQSEDMEVPFFTLATIVIATNNFSSYDKLGEGGFGLVKIIKVRLRSLSQLGFEF